MQTAKALGARVIAGASTPARREAALRDGADAVIDTGVTDWKDALKSAAGPRGVDVFVDPVGGDATEMAFRALGWGGRLLVIGFAAGAIGKLPANLALLKGAAMIGVDLRAFGEREPEAMRAVRERVFALHADGRVRPRIGLQVPVDDHARAFAATRDPGTLGRVVLRFG
ncbi:MAG: zinc-binding dehydrogenase, partial [Burkholderiaceae bacterium]